MDDGRYRPTDRGADAQASEARAVQEAVDSVRRLLGGLIAISAGVALCAALVIFAPSLAERMDASPGLFAKRFGAGMLWAGLISLTLIGGGLAAIFSRSRNSN